MALNSTVSKKLSKLLTPSKKHTDKKKHLSPESSVENAKVANAEMGRVRFKKAYDHTLRLGADKCGEELDMKLLEDDRAESDIKPLLSIGETFKFKTPPFGPSNRWHSTQLGELTTGEKVEVTPGGRRPTTNENASAKRDPGSRAQENSLISMKGGDSIRTRDPRMSTATSQGAASMGVKCKRGMPGLLSTLDNHAASGRLFRPTMNIFRTKPSVQTTVLHRRTARAEKWRKAHPELFKETTKARSKATRGKRLERELKVGEVMEKSVFPLLKLNTEIRQRIWREVVVENKVFIWPDSKLGRMQPDLAMVNCQIRREVLPIFYGQNIFAIDISPAMLASRGSGAPRSASSLKRIERWAEVLHSAKLLGYVRSLAFSYTPPDVWSAELDQVDVEHDKEAFIVSVRLRENSGLLAEVHRDARHLLPGIRAGHDRFAVSQVPKWLTEFIKRLEEPRRDGFKACFASEFAMILKAHTSRLQAEVP
ncbi:hypothetical protein K431DRAFT_291331 [Polychaeton citri CBS 116435]|uniref:Uncharacterized protein n=1 Tax=Polychaeton citri CBS 116435 TaxID=1314669 RepID=A0A9P4UQL8_9PEZI|nr:hypothetical protein K431DRAFT_291331 [Polychaeton citri CBS 116435]